MLNNSTRRDAYAGRSAHNGLNEEKPEFLRTLRKVQKGMGLRKGGRDDGTVSAAPRHLGTVVSVLFLSIGSNIHGGGLCMVWDRQKRGGESRTLTFTGFPSFSQNLTRYHM
jgi:hypothetical protein